MRIKKVHAYEIIASGGYPTVEVRIELEDGTSGVASVPYGASAGSHEASVMVDGGERFSGQGVLRAVDIINNTIAPMIIGKDVGEQKEIDKLMIEADGSERKEKFGGNSILAVSLACAEVGSASRNRPLHSYISELYGVNHTPTRGNLPKPMMVAIEGGKHAHNSTDLQEYSFVTLGDRDIMDHLQLALESYHSLKTVLNQEGLSTNVGNEGAFAPEGIQSNERPLELLQRAISEAGYSPGQDVAIAIDAAATEFFEDGEYNLKLEGRQFSAQELTEIYTTWLNKYPITSVEDMFAEDDWDAWTNFNNSLAGRNIMHLGDDLTVTNTERVKKAVEHKAINSVLIKLNQAGSLTETMECCIFALESGLKLIPSHRGGGETNSTFMVDLAVAVGAEYIKVGPTRGERVAKYNRLLEIERELS